MDERSQIYVTNIPPRLNWRDDLVVEDLDGDVQVPMMGSVATQASAVQSASAAKYEYQSPVMKKTILEAHKHKKVRMFQDVDEEGNPLVYSERPRHVTRAPMPEKMGRKPRPNQINIVK